MSIWNSIKNALRSAPAEDTPDGAVASCPHRYRIPVEQAFWVAARHLRAADLVDEHAHRVTEVEFSPRAKSRWTATATRLTLKIEDNGDLPTTYPTDLIRAWATAMLYQAGYKAHLHAKLITRAGL